MRFAIHLEIASEINAPPKPKIAEKTSKALMSKSDPLAANSESTPRILSVILSKTIMAMLVNKNKNILFMTFLL